MPVNIEYSFHAKCMGTSLAVSVIHDNQKNAQRIFEEIQNICATTESIFSRFDTHSELSMLNREKRIRPSPLFCSLLKEAKKAFVYTNRIFNPLCSPYFFGYTESFETQHFSEPIPLREKNFEMIEIDQAGILQIPEYAFLDFGGIIKGWLANNIAKQYASQCYGIIVNLGGDIAVQGSDCNSPIFSLSVWNPITKQNIAIPISQSTLCTSGSYKRKWKHHHHIIDPFLTASANSHCISASIIHPDGALCEAIATACVIWGVEKSIAFLEAKNIEYVLIDKDGICYRNISSHSFQ